MKTSTTLLTTLAGVTALTAMLSLTGCDRATAADSATPPAGKQCTIQFRRDALGTAASLPVSPLTGGINGADTSISGKLKSTHGEWLVLDHGGQEIWVPKATVLLIQF